MRLPTISHSILRPTNRALCLAGVSACTLALGLSAHAQAAPTTDDETGRERVVIVGVTIEETLPQELAAYGSDLETVSSEEIRNQGFVDAAQTLQMKVPGLFLAPRGGPFSYLDISLQGSRTSDMLFTVDGVRINNRLYSGTISDTLPASMIERIEVLKGGQSLFYGTQAAAGVINVVTRGYTDDFNGQVTVGGDTNDSLHFDAYVRGKAGPGNYVLFGSQDKSDGFQAYDVVQPSATDRNRSYDVNSFGGKYRLTPTDQLSFDARYQHTDARLDYPGARRTAYAKNERDEDIASLGVNYDASETVQIQIKGYWHDWDSNYTTINNLVPAGSGQELVDDGLYWGYEDKGVNALAKIDGGPLEYVLGYDFQQYSGRDDVLLIREQTEEVNAVFAQVRTTSDMIENGAFAAGVRYNDTGGATATVWNASGRYDFTPNVYVQGNVGTSFLLPTAEQLYAVDPYDPLGNPDLEPEESESANLSVGGAFGDGDRFGWQVTWFGRNINNLISDVTFADAGLDPSILYPDYSDLWSNGLFYNVPGEVQVRGFELVGTADFGNGFTGLASFTSTDSKMDGSANQIARIPKTYAKASASYATPSGRWGTDLNLLWTGEQSSSVSGFGAVNYGDYVVVDIAGHVYIDAEQHHKLTARLSNAFDEDYATRVSSTFIDGSTTERFMYANRGQPQTLHLTYSYAF
ncbi:MAG: TonB-dependent receptor [Hyphomonadaceae bacterium]